MYGYPRYAGKYMMESLTLRVFAYRGVQHIKYTNCIPICSFHMLELHSFHYNPSVIGYDWMISFISSCMSLSWNATTRSRPAGTMSKPKGPKRFSPRNAFTLKPCSGKDSSKEGSRMKSLRGSGYGECAFLNSHKDVPYKSVEK